MGLVVGDGVSEGAALGEDGTVCIDRDCGRAKVRRVGRRSRQVLQSMAKAWTKKSTVKNSAELRWDAGFLSN